jgi:cobalt-zinc-cadmium resistance protein CzcA
MPTMDEGDIIMQLEKLPSIGLEQTIAIDSRVQQAILARVPEIKAIVARAGADELGLDPMGLNQTDTFMVLQAARHLAQPDKAWLADQMRAVMADFPGIGFQLHPADRHARLGNADRRARRPGDQDLRPDLPR